MSDLIDALRNLTDTLEQVDEHDDRISALETRVAALEGRPTPPEDGTGAPLEQLDLGDDQERQTRYANQAGIKIEAHEPIGGLSARISPMTRTLSRALLKRAPGGEVLASTDISRLRPGDWYHLECDLDPGEYEVVHEAGPDGERNFARGRAAVDYPIESAVMDVTAGVYEDDGTTTGDYRYCINKLQPGVDFSGREREFGALDDVPPHADVIYAEGLLDLEGDVGAALQDLVDDLDDKGRINHAIVLPRAEGLEWSTQVRVPDSAAFFGLIADAGAHFELGKSLHHPITIGSRGSGVGAAIVRGVTWDIRGTDADGHPLDTGFLELFADRWFVVEDTQRIGRRQRWQYRDGEGPYDGYYRMGNAYGFFGAILEDNGVGAVEHVHSGGGIHNVRDPKDPIAERPGMSGEGIGFSGELTEGTVVYRHVSSEGSVGNTFYLRTGEATGTNAVEHCEIRNGSRSAIRLGDHDQARDNYIEFSDMTDRFAGVGLWFQQGRPIAEGLEVHSPDGNHELVRVSTDCPGGVVRDLRINAGANNDHHTIRCSGSGGEGVVVEDFRIVDRSNRQPLSGVDASISVTRPDVTLRNGTIDVSESPRGAIGGSHDPTLEDVEIVRE